MILYQSIGLYYYHLLFMVDVWVGEQSEFSGQKRAVRHHSMKLLPGRTVIINIES